VSKSYRFFFWLGNLVVESELRVRSKVLQGVRVQISVFERVENRNRCFAPSDYYLFGAMEDTLRGKTIKKWKLLPGIAFKSNHLRFTKLHYVPSFEGGWHYRTRWVTKMRNSNVDLWHAASFWCLICFLAIYIFYVTNKIALLFDSPSYQYSIWVVSNKYFVYNYAISVWYWMGLSRNSMQLLSSTIPQSYE